eukprot:scaffold240464_cov27-Tisochrysis_lutea.AAC.1
MAARRQLTWSAFFINPEIGGGRRRCRSGGQPLSMGDGDNSCSTWCDNHTYSLQLVSNYL